MNGEHERNKRRGFVYTEGEDKNFMTARLLVLYIRDKTPSVVFRIHMRIRILSVIDINPLPSSPSPREDVEAHARGRERVISKAGVTVLWSYQIDQAKIICARAASPVMRHKRSV